MTEYRISIYGRKQSEWDQLASWIVNNDLYTENVVWLIQNILDNIFALFEIIIDPNPHPRLHLFLKQRFHPPTKWRPMWFFKNALKCEKDVFKLQRSGCSMGKRSYN